MDGFGVGRGTLEMAASRRTGTSPTRSWALVICLMVSAGHGCTQIDRYLRPSPISPEQALAEQAEAKLEPEVAADVAGADHYYQQEEFGNARTLYHRLAEDESNPTWLAEKARFYEAECYRLQEQYPRAMEAYNRMLMDFPAGAYREPAIGHMYNIANYWLDVTRKEMAQREEVQAGERSFVMPVAFHFDKTKPFLDVEGNALKYLEEVIFHDPMGPYADKALWLCGYVNFYRGNYTEADFFLSQLVEHHPESKLRPKAIELAIMAKNNSTGGPAYDGRKSSEALQLALSAQTNCPELATRGDFLTRQIAAINIQQAEKDFQTAAFYERRRNPASAYFYYEIIRRRYPGTPFAEKAGQRMQALREHARRKQKHGVSWVDQVLGEQQATITAPPPQESPEEVLPAPSSDQPEQPERLPDDLLPPR